MRDRRGTALAGTVGFSLLASCGSEPVELPPPGHLLLHIDTDAPLPTPPGSQRDPRAPHPLFDRLRIDILRSGEQAPCPECSREFDLDEEVVKQGGSFSVQSRDPEQDLVLHVRMFRIASVVNGSTSTETTVEAFVALPSLPTEGALEVKVFLPTEALGQPLGTIESPVEAELGPAHTSRVGTWPGARRTGCATQPAPGRACVEGGAFWMGNPVEYADGQGSSTAQRLVVLSPFFVDSAETTVAAYRARGGAQLLDEIEVWSGDSSGEDPSDWCTFSATDGSRDALPINCITWLGARTFCLANGGDLPTEAQFEYLAGGLESRRYVWGFDDPTCDDAIWGRGVGFPGAITPCAGALGGAIGGPIALAEDLAGDPQPPRRRDVLVVDGVRIFDLGGNSEEWARDAFQRTDEPCWDRAGSSNVLTEPFCEAIGQDGDRRSVRGGSWLSGGGTDLVAANRWSAKLGEFLLNGSFRCVYPAEE